MMLTMEMGDYELAEACVEVFGQITEADYRVVEEMLGESLGRFKGWPTHYVFTTDDSARMETIASYCRGRGLAHRVSIEARWAAVGPRPVAERADVESVERMRRSMSTLYPGAAPKD